MPFPDTLPEAQVCGRLAPSPTGLLHLGNAWAFLLAWLATRAQDGRLILRIEDIDPQRSRPEFTAALLDDLRWLGLDWDQGPTCVNCVDCVDNGDSTQSGHNGQAGSATALYTQSCRTIHYAAALKRLASLGLIYPCFCTRKELRQLAAAPHMDDAGAPYPGTCRHMDPARREALLRAGRKAALRLRCPEDPIVFDDQIQGTQRFCLADCGGDFALRRSDGVVAYQLAVAVDDGLMGVSQVVRGRDILPSTPRQIALLRLLGYRVPAYAHIPLLLDHEGQRLAKRHQSLALRSLRQNGVEPGRVLGFLGRLAGLNAGGQPCQAAELLPGFALERLPKDDIRLDASLPF